MNFTLTEKIANLISNIEKLPCFNITERKYFLEIFAELESRICELESKIEELNTLNNMGNLP